MRKIIIGIILILVIVFVVYCEIDYPNHHFNTTDITYYAKRREFYSPSSSFPYSFLYFFPKTIPENAVVTSYQLYVDYSYNDEMLVLSFSDLNDLKEFVEAQTADYSGENLVIRESPYQEGYTEYFSDQHFPSGRYINDEKWEKFFCLEKRNDSHFFHGCFRTMAVSEKDLTVAIFDVYGKFSIESHIPSYVEFYQISVERDIDFYDEVVFPTTIIE